MQYLRKRLLREETGDERKGWRPFWAALLAALLVLLPLVGGTVLLTRRSLRTRLASRPQSGVAIRQPKEENRLSLLVCIAPTETTAPGFLLLYLNASQNCVHALALPGELTVPFGADETALSDCYRAAGRPAAGKHFSQLSPCPRIPTISPLRRPFCKPSPTGTGCFGWVFRER